MNFDILLFIRVPSDQTLEKANFDARALSSLRRRHIHVDLDTAASSLLRAEPELEELEELEEPEEIQINRWARRLG